MRRIFHRAATLIAALFVLGLFGGAHAQQQQTPPEEREVHGDWRILCFENNRCFMSQDKMDDQGRRIMAFNLRRLDESFEDNGTRYSVAAEILAPLGVYLPQGIRTQVDDGALGTVPFEFCAPIGCRAAAPIPDDFVDQLKAGGVVKFALLFQPGQPVTVIEMSLAGFTAALESL